MSNYPEISNIPAYTTISSIWSSLRVQMAICLLICLFSASHSWGRAVASFNHTGNALTPFDHPNCIWHKRPTTSIWLRSFTARSLYLMHRHLGLQSGFLCKQDWQRPVTDGWQGTTVLDKERLRHKGASSSSKTPKKRQRPEGKQRLGDWLSLSDECQLPRFKSRCIHAAINDWEVCPKRLNLYASVLTLLLSPLPNYAITQDPYQAPW